MGGNASILGPGITIVSGIMGSLLFIHWSTVLIRGRPVRWLFDAMVAVQRFVLRADAYLLLMEDRYPPFEGDWRISYDVDFPQRISRWRLVIWKTITSIPHFIALSVLFFLVHVLVLFAWFAILFTGRFPKGMYDFVAGWLRWNARVSAYWMSLTDVFPPFSLSAEAGPGRTRNMVISAAVGLVVIGALIGGIAALIAVPGQTDEAEVRYESLLDGEPSDVAEVGGVAVRLVSAEDPYEFRDDLYVPEPGERFLVFYLEIENGRGYGLRISGGDFSLKDTDGDSRDPFLVTLAGARPPRTLVEGGTGDAVVMFEVPRGADPAELTYSPQFGFKTKIRFVFD
jgi:hypothetical protein